MSRKFGGLLVTMASLALSEAFAAAAPYNCRSQAQAVQPQPSARVLTLVREWDEGFEVDGKIVGAGWIDEVDPQYPTPVHQQIGSCWLKVDLVKGRDYLFAVPESSDVILSLQKREPGIRTQFHYVSIGGQSYAYVRMEDWSLFDPASVGFYVKLIGGIGAVGKSVSFRFSQEKMPSQLGTVANPIPLDVSGSGEYLCIDQPAEKQFERWSTAFSASLAAGEYYTFKAYPPSSDIGIALTLPEGGWSAVPGNVTVDPEDSSLVVSVWRDYTLTFLAIPDDEHWDGCVAGGSLKWKVGSQFRGSLVDVDTKSVAAEFNVDYRKAGGTFASATIIVNGIAHEFVDAGAGRTAGERLIVGKTTVGGVDYNSVFSVLPGGDESASIDGSMTLDDGAGGAREFFFRAVLGDGDCMLTFDPNGGFGSVADISCEWGKVCKLPTADALTPPGGKTLVGWRCSTEGRQKDRLYEPGMLVFNLAGEYGKTLKFVAVWSD